MKKSILNWLDEQTKDNKVLSINWEGGNDSGWVYFQIDGEQINNEYTDVLTDYMYDELDYGSWAGEFNANGSALYNVSTRTFEGTDYCDTNDGDSLSTDIKINVPKKLWFDTLHIECETNYDESSQVAARFIVKNGFLIKEHLDFCNNLQEVLINDFDEIFDNYKTYDGLQFNSCNDGWILERKDAVKDDDDILVFKIDKIEIGTVITEEKYIVLELTDDIINNIDEKLKKKENAN